MSCILVGDDGKRRPYRQRGDDDSERRPRIGKLAKLSHRPVSHREGWFYLHIRDTAGGPCKAP